MVYLILGYIVNYYEDTIADNIGNLLAYPTNEEMHLIIHESHEQAIAFAQILEFVGYNCTKIFFTVDHLIHIYYFMKTIY